MPEEFRSKLEELMPAEELPFPPTPGFGPYRRFLEHAIAHPAKMNTLLLEWLVRAFSEPGDTLLDPMAGSGSLGVVAYLHGRNAIQVELEKKFCEWIEKASEKVQAESGNRGNWIWNICGDARRLSELLNVGTDAIITSPPYADTGLAGGDPERRSLRLIKAGFNPKDYLGGRARNAVLRGYVEVNMAITSPPYADAISRQGGPTGVERVGISTKTAREYSGSPENIGNLPLGDIDTIITSPPYSSTEFYYGEKPPDFWQKLAETTGRKAWLDPNSKTRTTIANKEKPLSEANIGNLPFGSIDAIITSPPYSEALSESAGGGSRKNALGTGIVSDGKRQGQGAPTPYSVNKLNIGNLPHGSIDTIITSPPYLKSADSGAGVNKQREGDVKIGCSTVGRTVSHPDAIDNAKEYGSIDAIITSPPYADAKKGGEADDDKMAERWDVAFRKAGEKWNSWGKTWKTEGRKRGLAALGSGYSDSRENIGNLPLGSIDTIITSPPYAHESTASKETRLEKLGLFKMGHSKEEPYTEEDYRKWSKHAGGNIGKRRLFIRVPCSPEEAQFHDTREGRKGTIWEWTKEVEATPEVIERIQKLKSEKKGKSETYLEAMLKVYGEMFKVLKPGGLAIIVVKPFIRNRKVVDLPYHTWLLMAKVGFQLKRLYKLRLERQSFWRILFYKRYPNVPIIAHEYVLVSQKPGEDEKPVEPKIEPAEFLLECAMRGILA